MHTFVSLNFYCSIHTDPTFLQISIKNQYTTTFIYHPTAKYVPATIMPIKCHIYVICQNYLTGINDGSMLTHMLHMSSQTLTMWPGALYMDDYTG